MLNISQLFYSTTGEPTFLKNLELSQEQKIVIQEAKKLVRQTLRDHLPRVLQSGGYVGVAPRFFTQGSSAYGTLNAPPRTSQQADIDDGTYLPLSFVAEAGKPSIAAKIFFNAVEHSLEPLVRKRKWNFAALKPTCIRVVIAPFAHIDIPLYAIPDNEFESLQKAARIAGYADISERFDSDEDLWTNLPNDHVLLAHREHDWVKSDPRPLKAWFLQEVERHGEQYRRCVRYVKAFRDWQWMDGGPASVLLMAASALAFAARDRRDDLALMDLVDRLPAVLRAGVVNPVDSSESLTDRLGPQGVTDAIAKLQVLGQRLRSAVTGEDAAEACNLIISQFGSRFPHIPSRVIVTTAASTVYATPAVAAPSPLVGRTQAG